MISVTVGGIDLLFSNALAQILPFILFGCRLMLEPLQEILEVLLALGLVVALLLVKSCREL